MNIEPGLLQHPKFLELQKRVGPGALEILVRLWGHCEHENRGPVWSGASVDPEYVEIVCRWAGRTGFLFDALLETGWIECRDGAVIIRNWAKYNPPGPATN